MQLLSNAWTVKNGLFKCLYCRCIPIHKCYSCKDLVISHCSSYKQNRICLVHVTFCSPISFHQLLYLLNLSYFTSIRTRKVILDAHLNSNYTCNLIMFAIFANNWSGCMESDILEKRELDMKEVFIIIQNWDRMCLGWHSDSQFKKNNIKN